MSVNINSVCPSYRTGRHRSMVIIGPGIGLPLYETIIRGVLWHSPENNFKLSAPEHVSFKSLFTLLPDLRWSMSDRRGPCYLLGWYIKPQTHIKMDNSETTWVWLGQPSSAGFSPTSNLVVHELGKTLNPCGIDLTPQFICEDIGIVRCPLLLGQRK